MKGHQQNRRRHAVDIFQAGLSAVDPYKAVQARCQLQQENLSVDGRVYDLTRFERVYVIGAGKAGASMGRAIEEILGDRITEGIISIKYDHGEPLQRVQLLEAAHPVPDENGLAAAKAIYDLVQQADEKTLVLCLISGGGSALMPFPVEGISLADKQETTRVLLASGATIHEINAIRKHLSVIKGGGLARAVSPATLATLILSDVIGDDLDSIASGPCVPDSTTFRDCLTIIDTYKIQNRIPAVVLDYLKSGVEGQQPETPKAGEPFFDKTQNAIIASNFDALVQAKEKAEALGYSVLLLSSMIEGETRDVAANHIAIAREIRKHGLPLAEPACLLSGGETTVTIQGEGKGGRNQEFVLAAAVRLAGEPGITVLSAGTDGTDGPTDAAGAIADETTYQRALALSLDARDYLDDNDSYHFFEPLNDLYITGPTRTNVMDIRIILVDSVSS